MPKSTKSIKVTDLNKGWNKRTGQEMRRLSFRESKDTFLIVCEGQTEELYFAAFPVVSTTVELHNLGGQSKLQLVKATEAIIEQANYNYDQVWCVFDMDVKCGEKEYSDFDNAINQAKSKGYKVAYSNDCFELWFYLHFNHIDQANHRTFYYEQLSAFWKLNYEKNGKQRQYCLNNYKRLQHDERCNQNDAIRNSQNLLEYQNSLPPSKQNPVTTVHLLVVELNKNLDR